MICNICNSKNLESSVNVYHLDRKVGTFTTFFGRKGGISFCDGDYNRHTKQYTNSKYPSTLRMIYHCNGCGNERTITTLYYDGNNFSKI
jgi:hypothetical protein